MKSVLIADDHPIVRKGLKQILNEVFPSAITGEARNAREVVDLVGKRRWDIVILDIAMPGRSGLDVLKELKQGYPALPVLVLSMHPEELLAVRALRAGAAGYLNKDNAPEELVIAIKKVLAGGIYVSASLAEKLAKKFALGTGKEHHEELSGREYEVMCLIASGKKVKDIADVLSLSVKTVSTYRTRVLKKMNMKSNVELARYAVEKGFVK
jgi:DNA-binding NarL/FixJ family response regulator